MVVTRAVLVGCGGISRAWFKAAQEMEGLSFVGLVDINRAAAEEKAAEFGLKDAVLDTDLGRVLQSTQPDVVFNCTIPDAHMPVTLEALEHGCHVLGEKPLADSMENAYKMIEAARKANRIFAVIQNRRYNANIRRLRAFLESGVIGRITTVNSDFYLGAHFGGFRDRMEHVLLLDMAIHSFDQARLISGTDPVSVYAKEWNPAGSWYDHDASAVALFQMTDGVVYTYRGSWCAEGLNTTWECDWRIVGDKGTVTWDGAEGFKCQVVAKSGGFRSEWADVPVAESDPGDKVGGHAGVMRDFLRAVRTGGTPETVCTDNVKSLAMVFGAIRSAQTGREEKTG
ncbi:MAG: Gfo/Idh/MocA family oxidoreductase [Chloroflexi bacterium]|nr:Gfo/Idh/MocA family oxidoreductase [Chloroflexota bacterium]